MPEDLGFDSESAPSIILKLEITDAYFDLIGLIVLSTFSFWDMLVFKSEVLLRLSNFSFYNDIVLCDFI
jgi:hypothetical protein